MPRTLTAESAAALLAAAMEQINAQRKKNERVEAAPATVLVGPGAALDSLLLLNFLVAAEEKLRDDHGLELSLVDLLGQPVAESPLRSVATLTEHLVAASSAP